MINLALGKEVTRVKRHLFALAVLDASYFCNAGSNEVAIALQILLSKIFSIYSI